MSIKERCYISTHDLTGKFKSASPELLSIIGYDVDEVIHRDIYDLFHEKDKSRIYTESHILSLYGVKIMKYRFHKKNGGYIWLKTYSWTNNDEIICLTKVISGLNLFFTKFYVYLHNILHELKK